MLLPEKYFGEGAWDVPRQLSALDAVLWRIESHHRLRSPCLLILMLERFPEWDRFVAGHEWASRMVPRLRERPLMPLSLPLPPMWTPDPEFHPSRHVRRAALPEPAGKQQLLDLAAALVAAPFDWSRPPWESILIDRVSWDGQMRVVWILRYHHSLADGAVLLAWLDGLLSRSPEPRWDKPQPPSPVDRHSRVALPDLCELGAQAAAFGRQMLRVGEWKRALKAARDMAAAPVPLSPLLANRSSDRRVEVCTVPTAGLLNCAQAADVAPGDVFIAGVAGGFRRYHENMGVELPYLSMVTPELTRTGPARAGNSFSVVRFAPSLAHRDPWQMISEVNQRLSQAKRTASPLAVEAVLALAGQLPTPVLTELGRHLGATYDVQVSVFGLLLRPLYVSGVRIAQIIGVGPLPNCPAMAVLVPRPDDSAIAITLDPAAVTDGTELMRCLEESFAELVALAGEDRRMPEGAQAW